MVETKEGERLYWAIIAMILIGTAPWVSHMWRNTYLTLFTDREPVPMLLTEKIAPHLVVSAAPENNIYKSTEDLYVTVTNNSAIPVWKISLTCTVVYANDSNGPRVVETTLFAEKPIMPRQSQTGVDKVFNGAGHGTTGCQIKRVKTPISWWSGIPSSMFVNP